uniref:Uncharacterized protein n=1 Tax=Anguilla anguilla TaxID=7936 RepID=A0A0E9PLR5_ANGAN
MAFLVVCLVISNIMMLLFSINCNARQSLPLLSDILLFLQRRFNS